jgi:hypothetical protein
MERVLSSHPRVRGCGELDFWTEYGPAWVTARADTPERSGDRLCEEYLRLLRADAVDVLRATDKMPLNFLWVGLIHLLFPNARIIHCRRDPVDTCLSIYTTPLRAALGFSNSLADLVSYYRLYLRLMDHWRVVIPKDRLLDVDYEDLVARPESAAKRLVSFIGLQWDPACLRPEENPDVVATASHWQARQPIYRSSVARWRYYEPWIAELRDLGSPL